MSIIEYGIFPVKACKNIIERGIFYELETE